jgi:hypothetical protein
VIGQHDVFVPEVAGGARHDLDRVDAIGPCRVGVRVAANVVVRHQGRQPTGERGLDLAVALAQFRGDPWHAQSLVDIGLLRVEQVLQFSPVKEDAPAFGALVDYYSVALVLVHQILTFRTEHLHDSNLS